MRIIVLITAFLLVAFLAGSTAMASDKEYIVQRGDTLWKIASREVGSNLESKVKQITTDNNISNPDLIKVGQVIKIKEDGKEIIRVVKKGDVLSAIALNALRIEIRLKAQEIAKENGVGYSDSLREGQVILLAKVPKETKLKEVIDKNVSAPVKKKVHLAEKIDLPIDLPFVISFSLFFSYCCFLVGGFLHIEGTNRKKNP